MIIFLILCASLKIVEPLNLTLTKENLWTEFKTVYNKDYAREDEIEHKKIFFKNFASIIRHNEDFENLSSTYELGINKFSDRVPKQMKYFNTHLRDFKLSSTNQHAKLKTFPIRNLSNQMP